jgi:hypothetical protein
MASFRTRGKIWYFKYTDANGVKHEQRGCPDERVTKQMAASAEMEAAKIRGGLIDPKDVAYRDHAARPVAEHLDQWHQDMVAMGKTPNHAGQYRDRTSTLIALVKATPIGDLEQGRSEAFRLWRERPQQRSVLSQAHFGDLSPESIQSALVTLSDFGKSNQTVNHYRAAIRAFLRWAHERKRIREIPMGVTSLNAEEDQRVRRILTDDELGRLVHMPSLARSAGICRDRYERWRIERPPGLVFAWMNCGA